MKKLVLFGAGKIGRSFIGQLFARSGFEVVFIDISRTVINELNCRRGYHVIIKSDMPDSVLEITGVRGILASDKEKVAEELADADISAVSVGQKGLPQAMSSFAEGLLLRKKRYGNLPLDLILAENMHNADQYARSILQNKLGPSYPVEALVGLIETSIGKMVPIMPLEVQQKDPLLVYAESFNTLILDKKAFKNPIPDVDGLAPKENMKAWVDRKSHIHNFGHAAAAYKGFRDFPDAKLLADILEIKQIKDFTRRAMLESSEILMKKYPGEFTPGELAGHIDDLLNRFCNRALGDTIYRVGCDLKRKLHRDDRVLGPMIDGIALKSPVNYIIQTFINALKFEAADETGNRLADDIEFSRILNEKGLNNILYNICGLHVVNHRAAAEKILAAAESGNQQH